MAYSVSTEQQVPSSAASARVRSRMGRGRWEELPGYYEYLELVLHLLRDGRCSQERHSDVSYWSWWFTMQSCSVKLRPY